GEVVAAALAGAWRPSPPPLPLSARAFAEVVPFLLETGGAGLLWRRVRQSDLRDSAPARRLRYGYRQAAAGMACHEQQLQQVIGLLRDAGVTALLVKGWSIARLYPESGLRPPGDIDLCVRPDHLPRALTVLTANAAHCRLVDLHAGVADLEDRT